MFWNILYHPVSKNAWQQFVKNMKKLTLVLGIAIFLMISSCRDTVNAALDNLPSFTIPFTTTIQAPFLPISDTNYTPSPEIPMNIDLDSEIKKQNPNFSVNNMKSVKLNEMTVDLVDGAMNYQLNIIKNAKLYIKSPNQPEKLIATVTNNTHKTRLTFVTNDTELIDYFRTNQNSLIIEVLGIRISAEIFTLKLNTAFKIRAQL